MQQWMKQLPQNVLEIWTNTVHFQASTHPEAHGGEAQKIPPSPTLMLFNARSINKTVVLQNNFFVDHQVDLACMTETRVREGETVALKELAPPGFSVIHQSQTSGSAGCTSHLRVVFF